MVLGVPKMSELKVFTANGDGDDNPNIVIYPVAKLYLYTTLLFFMYNKSCV